MYLNSFDINLAKLGSASTISTVQKPWKREQIASGDEICKLINLQSLFQARPGIRQVPEGSGEQGKVEKTGCKIICGAPTTLAGRGLMMNDSADGHQQGRSAYQVL